MKKFLLIDANALIHRAYHALPALSNRKGQPINAVYGFTSTLLSALKKIKPDYALAGFDLPQPTFRHKMFKNYKANRIKGPSDLYEQIPLVAAVLKAFGLPALAVKGYEADDIIGTVANKINKYKKEIKTIILTGDLDTLQLVNKNTVVYTPKKGLNDPVVYNIKKINQRYGLKPKQIVDFKALKGDPSDNIPGVPGIGEKTATGLLQKHKNLKNIYNNLDKIKQSTRTKLEENEDQAWFSRKLAKINQHVSLKFELDKCKIKNYNKKKVVSLFQNLGFKSLIKRINK